MQPSNLIPVFKPSNPDQVFYADQQQINDQPDKLIKVANKEAWLKANAPKAASKQAEAEPEPKAPAKPTKAELLKQAQDRGIPVTKKMTVEQLENALKEAA